jgi:hypothetical protein
MSNWKFSWGPFYRIYEAPSSAPARTVGYSPFGVPVYDPPHGDYYSKPSQPKYEAPCGGLTSDQIIARDRAAIEREVERVRREGNLIRQAHAEPFAVAYYFWLGIDAEHRLW